MAAVVVVAGQGKAAVWRAGARGYQRFAPVRVAANHVDARAAHSYWSCLRVAWLVDDLANEGAWRAGAAQRTVAPAGRAVVERQRRPAAVIADVADPVLRERQADHMALAAADQVVADPELGAAQGHEPIEIGAVLAVPFAVGSGGDRVVAHAVAGARAQATVAMRLTREVGWARELGAAAVGVQVDRRPVVVALGRLGQLVEADPQVGGCAH